jgi:hypothetical protein
MPTYPKEQLQQLYKNLPKDLKEALFSQQNANNIQEICTKNGVKDKDKIYDIIGNVGYVLLGLLPPNEFRQVLEYELKIPPNSADLIAKGITRFVFLPLKKTLEALYKTEIKVEPTPGEAAPPPSPKEEPKGEDVYREPIE